MVIRIQIPPERDGLALEGNQQAVRNGEYDVKNHDPADNPDVPSVDGDTEEEETNTDLEGCCGKCVEDFAKEPVLFKKKSSVMFSVMDAQSEELTIKPICAVSSSSNFLFLPLPWATPQS